MGFARLSWWTLLALVAACTPELEQPKPESVAPSESAVVEEAITAPEPVVATVPGAESGVPRAAYQYQRDLIRNARVVWGIAAPIATFAAQIHQESGWRADAKSKYASGLAQFTPATADWISQLYAGELGANQPLNPSWALRALVVYDDRLWKVIIAVNGCERMAMTLSSYNGGLGWLQRDIKLAKDAGADPARWFDNVEHYSNRAQWAVEENRGYPRRILLKLEKLYARWGPTTGCVGIV